MSASPLVPVKEVAQFIRGINFKPEDVVEVGAPGTIACMRTKNVQAELDLTDVWAVPERFVKRAEQVLQHGDILVSSANSWNLVGKCSWIAELPYRSSFGGFVSVLRPNPKKVIPKYLFHWFSSDNIQNTVRSFGQQTTNISNLNIERCLNLLIPLPTITEQRRITEVLDNAHALQVNRHNAIEHLGSLSQSIFLDMFGDPTENQNGFAIQALGTCVKLKSGYAFKSTDYVSKGIPLIRIGEVNRGIDLDNICYLPEELEQQLSRFIVRPNAILMSLTGTTGKDDYGNATLLSSEFPKYFLNQRVAHIEPKDETINSDYLLSILKHPRIKKKLTDKSRGIRQANISNGDILELKIPIPPLKLQAEYSKKIAKLDHAQKLMALQEGMFGQFFDSIQYLAFQGAL